MTVELVLFTRDHLAPFSELARDSDVLRFTRFPAELPAGFAERWLAGYEDHRAAGTREAFAILVDGTFAGFAVAVGMDAETQTAELGYAIAPRARGRGIATEALRQLTDWALARGLQRLELRIGADNAASRRVAERCGYVYEGTLRSLYFKDGQRADTELWSLLPSDRA